MFDQCLLCDNGQSLFNIDFEYFRLGSRIFFEDECFSCSLLSHSTGISFHRQTCIIHCGFWASRDFSGFVVFSESMDCLNVYL